MGQLEKYGLYVMCLVIFLILGVTLWGEPANATRTAGREQAAMHAGASGPQDAAFQRSPSRPSSLDTLLGPVKEQPKRYRPGDTVDKPAPVQERRSPQGGSSLSEELAAAKPEPVTKREVSTEPVAVSQPKLSTKRPTYQVKKGDVLSMIAQKQCGSTRHLQRILDLNPELDSPDDVRIGDTLVLPSPAELGATSRKSANEAVASGAYRTYRIRKGDNYEAIAIRMLGSAARKAELIRMNSDKPPRNLQIGAEIKLPLN